MLSRLLLLSLALPAASFVATTRSISGVRDCTKLRAFILDACRHALSGSLAHATRLVEQGVQAAR